MRLVLPLLVTILFAVIGLHVGSSRYGILDILEAIVAGDGTSRAIAEYRVTRVAASLLTGAALAAGGAGLQHVLRNPLVDPYLLGISSGAALGAVASIAVFGGDPVVLQASALAGGLSAYAVTVSIAGLAGMRSLTLIVVGVSVGYLAYSGAVLLITLMPDRIPYAFSWLLGTLSYTTREDLKMIAASALAGILMLAVTARRVEAMSLGDERAASMGVEVALTRMIVVTGASLAAAATVSVAGPIGFVGLTAPWIARLTGESRYTRVLAASLLWGAALVAAGDVLARGLFPPRELPLTPVMSLAGAPLLAYLAVKRHGGGG